MPSKFHFQVIKLPEGGYRVSVTIVTGYSHQQSLLERKTPDGGEYFHFFGIEYDEELAEPLEALMAHANSEQFRAAFEKFVTDVYLAGHRKAVSDEGWTKYPQMGS
jgi:hypothetical protein